MAELAVFNIAKSLLPQLSSLAKDELLLWYNSKTELEKLENTIRTIKDVLLDAEQRQSNDADVRGWLLRLRDEMYKADDLFDSISTRALRKRVMSGNKLLKETRLFFSKSNHLAFIVSTAHQVKQLRERLDSIAKDINQFGFLRRPIADERPFVKTKQQSHSYIREDQVIGREEDKEKILRLLLEDAGAEQCVSLIAVVGIGGLGKTTLAQLVYSAKETEEFFDLRLWACVNDFSDLKEALEEVMGVKMPSLDELQNMLRKKIHGKKFLLVLDDVWDDIRERWLGLKALLDVGERGSKVLITTRLTTVAQNLATVRPYHTLGELSDEQGWCLFKKMAFDSNQAEENQAKEALGSQIVNKCPKVPLAIRTIASFLYNKDKKQWSSFVNNEVMKVLPSTENMIMEALKISYDDLPPSLKHCFAYCSLFPKDYKFDKTTLIHLWMAQGLLQTSAENHCLEDVGESYFMHLVQRCFFQDVELDANGDIRSCKMHDLFHDLAAQIGGKECLMMTKFPNDFMGKFPAHLLVGEIKDSILPGKGIRSLVSLNIGVVKRELLDGVFLNLTSLRTLILRHLDVEEVPSSIGKLVHLRYLDLMKSTMKRLPEALCNLQNLLILRLGGCSNLIKLPDDLQKLISLRYVEIKGCDSLKHIPMGLEKMTSLVMLDRFVVNEVHGGLRCLKHLNNLTGALRIELPRRQWKNCVVDAEESMLRSKTNLSELVISFRRLTGGEEMLEADALLDRLQPPNNISNLNVQLFPGVNFPDWLSSLTNLVHLGLSDCSSCLELPHLRQLYQLKSLRLSTIFLVEYVLHDPCYDSGPIFPSLEKLGIYNMPNLKGWCRPKGGEVFYSDHLWFPRLCDLEVLGCPRLTCFPLCPAVRNLSLIDVHVNLVTGLVEANNSVVSPSPSSLQTCSQLYDVRLFGIKDLALLPDAFKLLPGLRYLTISDCPNLKRHSLFCSLQYLPSLESLAFGGSREIDLHDDENREKEGMPWVSLTRLTRLCFEFGSDPQGARLLKGLHHLPMLKHLNIYRNVPEEIDMKWTAPPNVTDLYIVDMNKVACLNRVIQQFEKLQSLYFDDCTFDEHEWDKLPWEDLKALRYLSFSDCDMKSLPEKCRHLPALEDLHLYGCHELDCLPTWVSKLTSLTIESSRHPELKEKCRKPVGSYWPLIRDIPHLTI